MSLTNWSIPASMALTKKERLREKGTVNPHFSHQITDIWPGYIRLAIVWI